MAGYIANTGCILLCRGKMVRFYTFQLMTNENHGKMRDSIKGLSIVYERLFANVRLFHIIG